MTSYECLVQGRWNWDCVFASTLKTRKQSLVLSVSGGKGRKAFDKKCLPNILQFAVCFFLLSPDIAMMCDKTKW